MEQTAKNANLDELCQTPEFRQSMLLSLNSIMLKRGAINSEVFSKIERLIADIPRP